MRRNRQGAVFGRTGPADDRHGGGKMPAAPSQARRVSHATAATGAGATGGFWGACGAAVYAISGLRRRTAAFSAVAVLTQAM